MKKRLLILTLIAAVTSSYASFASADTVPAGVTGGTDVSTTTPQDRGARFKQQREDKMAAKAALLGLTDAQQSQIKAIITAARQANAPLREKLASDRKKIKTLASAIPFDEAAVRTVMASDESARTELAISRIKVKKQIQAVLTPEQQAKAKELRQFDSNRHHKEGKGDF